MWYNSVTSHPRRSDAKTTVAITDPVLLKQLADATGPILFRDPDGDVVHQSGGRFGVPPGAGSAPRSAAV